MASELDAIYQTGEKVPHNGRYEVVGVNLKRATRELHLGEAFPSYEGWEVCWHLECDCEGRDTKAEPEQAAKSGSLNKKTKH